MTEINIQKIFVEAKKLDVIIHDKLARKVLEIDENASSERYSSLLSRLIRGVEQYVNKDQSIVYVGFVGHYSSGKSSTINNLLNLHSTSDERATDLNPTDTAITLITNKSNSKDLLLMNKESKTVPVRTTFLDSDFLKSLVIADTPGSGDPQIINEMIQDFIPICDYILYFISAANPIDQADIPLLHQMHLKLPFIPLHFVITRTDEFRERINEPLTENNLNTAKLDSFVGQLIARLKEFTDAGEILPKDFSFIDNKYKYGIPQLGEKISVWGNGLDKTELLKNHGYKLDYFQKNLKEIEAYFESVIKEKIRISEDFLITANENIKRFDKSVEVNNEKLRLLWTSGSEALKRSLGHDQDLSKSIYDQNVPNDIRYVDDLVAQRKVISDFVDGQAQGYLGMTVNDLKNLLKVKQANFRSSILALEDSVNFLDDELMDHFPNRINLGDFEELTTIDFSRMNDVVNRYADKSFDTISYYKNAMLSKVDSIRNLAKRELVITTINENYAQGSKIITENFSDYFEMIQMYKNTVLTRNTKETIEKLRIGMQLDELDDDFPEEFKQLSKEQAISGIYFLKDEDIANHRASLNTIDHKLMDIRVSIEIIVPERHINRQNFQKEDLSISNLLQSSIQESEEQLNLAYREKLLQFVEDHSRLKSEYSLATGSHQKHRKKVILKWTLLTGALMLILYVGLLNYEVIMPTTLFWGIIIGLITTGIGNVLGFGFGSFKADVGKMLVKHKQQFSDSIKEKFKARFDEEFWIEFSKISPDGRGRMQQFINEFNNRLTPIITQINNKNQFILSTLQNKNTEIKSCIDDYNSKINLLHNKFQTLFIDPEKNLEKIKAITLMVKTKAIEPSFELLENTKSNLEEVKHQIEIIDN